MMKRLKYPYSVCLGGDCNMMKLWLAHCVYIAEPELPMLLEKRS